jgi:hypothetical protein
VTTPTRDRVREALDVAKQEVHRAIGVYADARAAGKGTTLLGELNRAITERLDAYRDALLDAVDEDVARLEKVVDDDGVLSALPSFRNSKVGYNSAITDTRAAIRAHKETT